MRNQSLVIFFTVFFFSATAWAAIYKEQSQFVWRGKTNVFSGIGGSKLDATIEAQEKCVSAVEEAFLKQRRLHVDGERLCDAITPIYYICSGQGANGELVAGLGDSKLHAEMQLQYKCEILDAIAPGTCGAVYGRCKRA
jgi:hypothetical protein